MLELLRPNRLTVSVKDINFEELHNAGLYYPIFDLDSTIMAADLQEVDPDILAVILDATDKGLIKALAVMSNIWVPNRYRLNRIALAAQQIRACCSIPLIPPTLKPKALGYEEAMRGMGSCSKNTYMVGDQLRTDILGANRLGIYTILVLPIGRDPWFTAWKRERDNQILRHLHYQQQRVASRL